MIKIYLFLLNQVFVMVLFTLFIRFLPVINKIVFISNNNDNGLSKNLLKLDLLAEIGGSFIEVKPQDFNYENISQFIFTSYLGAKAQQRLFIFTSYLGAKAQQRLFIFTSYLGAKAQQRLYDRQPKAGINYTSLRELLKAGKWQEADIETGELMRKITNQNSVLLDNDAINNFPCKELRTIDRLWLKYSNNHFGFSVQKKIWLELGGKIDDTTNIKLSQRLGWFKQGKWIDYPNLIFTTKAPEGHLPFSGMIIYSEHGEYIDNQYVATAQGWTLWPTVLIMQRVLQCNI